MSEKGNNKQPIILTTHSEAQNVMIGWWINLPHMTPLNKRAFWGAREENSPAGSKQRVQGTVQAA